MNSLFDNYGFLSCGILNVSPREAMKLPAASSGVSKYQPHKTNLAASCGELTPIEIRVMR